MIRAELGGWTREGIVRQAAFKGFDEGGKPPTEVVREKAMATSAAVDAAEAAVPDPEEDAAMPSKTRREAEGDETRNESRRRAGGETRREGLERLEGPEEARDEARDEAQAEGRVETPSLPGRPPPTSSPPSRR